MSETHTKIVVVATPTAPLLSHLLHALSHEASLDITVLTRQTSVKIPIPAPHTHSEAHRHDHNGTTKGHHHSSKFTHTQTDFSESELSTHLKSQEIIICTLTGSDLHLSAPIIDAATLSKPTLFIPSEYSLDTSNSLIRSLLPPYQTRYEIQEKLRATGLFWRAIYAGVVLEEALTTDGVMGVDSLWGSVVIFPGSENTKIAISSYADIATAIVEEVRGAGKQEKNEVWTCGFRCSLEGIIKATERELEKEIDRYEGDFEGARKEAKERMKMGYFDGGVALMGKVAVWDGGVNAWGGWKAHVGRDEGHWEGEVRRVVRMVRGGEIGGGGCGC